MRLAALLLLFAGCSSAASDVITGLSCVAHPSRLDDGCRACDWHVAYPRDAAFVCGGQPTGCEAVSSDGCSSDGVTMLCDGGVRVVYDTRTQTARITDGDCHEEHDVHVWREML